MATPTTRRRCIGITLIAATSIVGCSSAASTETARPGNTSADADADATPVVIDDAESTSVADSAGAAVSATGDEALCEAWFRLEGSADASREDADILSGLEEVQRSAPDAIAGEAAALVDLFTTVLEFETAVETGAIDEADPAFAQAEAELDRNGEAVEAYVDANCAAES